MTCFVSRQLLVGRVWLYSMLCSLFVMLFVFSSLGRYSVQSKFEQSDVNLDVQAAFLCSMH